MKQQNSIPGEIIPPPLVVLALLMLSFFLHSNNPLRIRNGYWDLWMVAGGIMLLISGVLALSALRIMCSHKTPIDFKNPTTIIINKGPFGFTRNPLYVSLIMLNVGIGLVGNSFWVLLSLFALFFYLRRVVIQEEKYLENTFGDEYISYKKTVRRWI